MVSALLFESNHTGPRIVVNLNGFLPPGFIPEQQADNRSTVMSARIALGCSDRLSLVEVIRENITLPGEAMLGFTQDHERPARPILTIQLRKRIALIHLGTAPYPVLDVVHSEFVSAITLLQ